MRKITPVPILIFSEKFARLIEKHDKVVIYLCAQKKDVELTDEIGCNYF